MDTYEFAGSSGGREQSELNVDAEYDANRNIDLHNETRRPHLDSKCDAYGYVLYRKTAHNLIYICIS